MRLASKVSGTTSVAPASWQLPDAGIVLVRTSTGTSGRQAAHAVQDADRGGGIGETDDDRAGGPQPIFVSSFPRPPNRRTTTGSPAWRAARIARRVESSAMVFETL